MLFRRHLPSNGLSAFVADLWLYRGCEGAHSHERILPSGTFEMVFNLREDQLRIYPNSDTANCRVFSGAVVSGPYAGTFLSDKAEEASLLGVHFRPGGASPFRFFLTLCGSSAVSDGAAMGEHANKIEMVARPRGQDTGCRAYC